MNKPLLLSIVFFLFVAKSLFAQMSIRGEGEVVKQEITLQSIHGIDLGFSGDVILTPGSTQKIVIEGQQNIIDNIKREVRDGKWKIYFDKNVKDAKPVTVYITLQSVDYVGLGGSGSIRSTGKFSGLDELWFSVSGSGDIAFDYEAEETELSISGSGEIDLSGSTGSFEISISGSGDVRASNLKAATCEIHISGSGNAKVQVNGDLEAQISGSGDVYYSGTASVTARISGSGSVNKL